MVVKESLLTFFFTYTWDTAFQALYNRPSLIENGYWGQKKKLSFGKQQELCGTGFYFTLHPYA